MVDLIDLFEKETECVYKGECYSVRDNGSIMRHAPEGKKPRPSDEKWTFGTYDPEDGYAKLCGQTVHRIVAFAFLGEPPTKQHVVDHIDTNRRNNRPDNLRWVTKLENILLNPVSRKKLEFLCGCSIEELLKDWSILRNKNLDSDFSWMRAVTKEEAAATLESWNKWVEEGTARDGRRRTFVIRPRSGLVNKVEENTYIPKPNPQRYEEVEENPYILEPESEIASLDEYFKQLEIGKIFYRKHYRDTVGISKIIDFHLNKEEQTLYVACECPTNPIKGFYLEKIKVIDNKYDYGGRSLFDSVSIEKYMTIARGEEWTGRDTIDDYC